MLVYTLDFCWRAAMTLIRRSVITVVRLMDYHGNIDHFLPAPFPLLLFFSVKVWLQRCAKVLLHHHNLLFLLKTISVFRGSCGNSSLGLDLFRFQAQT